MAYAGIDIGHGWSQPRLCPSSKTSLDSTALDLSVGCAFGSPSL
jgi:hypothetical protein